VIAQKHCLSAKRQSSFIVLSPLVQNIGRANSYKPKWYSNMDPQILVLLGAGFSRNWGGWLAAEADEYLLGHPSIDRPVRDVLWHHRHTGGFEGALGELQRNDPTGQRLASLQSALMQMFRDMDEGFVGVNFNFNSNLKESISTFLSRFDAIFSLNQDLLLERHYLERTQPTSARDWDNSAPTIPCVTPILSTNPDMSADILVTQENSFCIPPGRQPYFKLHGSQNWRRAVAGSTEMLIMGGNKSGLIDKFPLLKWYHDEFKIRLMLPQSKLMVIGYSFGDDHINRTIKQAVSEADLRVFIVDPQGVNVLDKNYRHLGMPSIYTPDELLQCMWCNIIGSSRRTLREIFVTDRVEYNKLMRFFEI
jgi:SIR2-like domain